MRARAIIEAESAKSALQAGFGDAKLARTLRALRELGLVADVRKNLPQGATHYVEWKSVDGEICGWVVHRLDGSCAVDVYHKGGGGGQEHAREAWTVFSGREKDQALMLRALGYAVNVVVPRTLNHRPKEAKRQANHMMRAFLVRQEQTPPVYEGELKRGLSTRFRGGRSSVSRAADVDWLVMQVPNAKEWGADYVYVATWSDDFRREHPEVEIGLLQGMSPCNSDGSLVSAVHSLIKFTNQESVGERLVFNMPPEEQKKLWQRQTGSGSLTRPQ